MEVSLIYTLLLGAGAGFANILGGLILRPVAGERGHHKWLRYLMAIGAGFMLAVTLLEIFPHVIELWHVESESGHSDLALPMALILFGFFGTQLLEHAVFPHIHVGEEVKSDHLISGSVTYAALGGLLVHTIFDGISIAVAANINAGVGMMVFLAIALHKIPEGLTIASIMLASGRNFRSAMMANILVAGATLCGAIIFFVIGSEFTSATRYALPIAAGVTLYVSASDLIPELHHHAEKRTAVSLSVLAGAGLFGIIHYFMHSVAH